MEGTGDRIRQYRRRLGLTQSELAKKIGSRQATVADWETGKSEPEKFAVALSKALGVNAHWLLTGEGLPRLTDEENAQAAQQEAKIFGDMYAKLTPEQLSLAQAKREGYQEAIDDMKQGRLPTAEKPVTSAHVLRQSEVLRKEMPAMHELPVLSKVAADYQPSFVKAKHTQFVDLKYSRKDHYCLQVQGHSMRPNILEGDIVVVQAVNYTLDYYDEDKGPADKTFWKSLHGKVVCAIVEDDDPVLKRVRLRDRPGGDFFMTLQGDNAASEMIEITHETRLRIVGIVKQIMRDPSNVL